MTKPDDEEDKDDLDEDEEDEEESPPPPKAKPQAAVSKAKGTPVKAAPAKPLTQSHLIGIGVIALLLGAAGGWFGHIQQTKAALKAESAGPVGSGAPSGPCGVWQTKLCTTIGEQSATCQQAKAAQAVLVPPVCEAALGSLPATLAKIKAARASCDKLVGKLCADLPPGSKTCAMVKERTPSFPSERCDQMLQSYDKVIAELKQMEEQGGPQMGGPGGMRPPGAMPGAAPAGMPGGMPHIQIPQSQPQPH